MKAFRHSSGRVIRWFLFLVLTLFLVFFFYPDCPMLISAEAATLTVNTLADNQVDGDGLCTLREAIQAINAGTDLDGSVRIC